jgi:hypothetical protein
LHPPIDQLPGESRIQSVLERRACLLLTASHNTV